MPIIESQASLKMTVTTDVENAARNMTLDVKKKPEEPKFGEIENNE